MVYWYWLTPGDAEALPRLSPGLQHGGDTAIRKDAPTIELTPVSGPRRPADRLRLARKPLPAVADRLLGTRGGIELNSMSVAPAHPRPPRVVIPRLESGDRLGRAEFERRYGAMPDVKKAELIEGVVYMPSPVRTTVHGQPHAFLAGWMVYYRSKTPRLAATGDNATVRLDDENEVQPDLFLLLPKAAGGTAELDEDGYVQGPPDLVCEVASSSVSIDLHAKLNAYCRTGVREYLVWRTEDQEVDWFALRGGKYEPLPHTPEGIFKSEVFPGLWLHAAALLEGDLPRVFQVVDTGVASDEHAAFAARLAERT